MNNYLNSIIYRLCEDTSPLPEDLSEALVITDSPELGEYVLKSGNAVIISVIDLDDFDRAFRDTHVTFPHICTDIEDVEEDYFERVYRRFHNIPWDILETDRCLLRESTVDDVDSFLKIYSDPSVTEYMEDLYPPEEERSYMRKYIDNAYHYYGFGIWTVIDKESGEIIGRAGIDTRDGEEDPEIGFVIDVRYRHKGIAFEICRAILEYGFTRLSLPRLQAFVAAENTASVRLLEKLGMRKSGSRIIGGTENTRYVIDNRAD